METVDPVALWKLVARLDVAGADLGPLAEVSDGSWVWVRRPIVGGDRYRFELHARGCLYQDADARPAAPTLADIAAFAKLSGCKHCLQTVEVDTGVAAAVQTLEEAAAAASQPLGSLQDCHVRTAWLRQAQRRLAALHPCHRPVVADVVNGQLELTDGAAGALLADPTVWADFLAAHDPRVQAAASDQLGSRDGPGVLGGLRAGRLRADVPGAVDIGTLLDAHAARVGSIDTPTGRVIVHVRATDDHVQLGLLLVGRPGAAVNSTDAVTVLAGPVAERLAATTAAVAVLGPAPDRPTDGDDPAAALLPTVATLLADGMDPTDAYTSATRLAA